MKEENMIHKIREKTDKTPVPNTLSPEAMKHLIEDSKKGKMNVSFFTFKKFAYIACLFLFFLGGTYLYKESYPMKENLNIESTEKKVAEKKNEKRKQIQTSLKSPKNYTEYFYKLKDTYKDSYYAYNKSESDSIVNNDKQETETPLPSDYAERSSFSTTNRQENNVDEGDIIKTDGTYIYKLSKKFDHNGNIDNYLSITQAQKGNLTTTSNLSLNKFIPTEPYNDIDFHEFYLDHNQLFLMASHDSLVCDYENLCEQKTYILILDITNRKHPKQIKTLTQSGIYKTSRIHDGYLYTMSDFFTTSLEEEKNYSNYIPSIEDHLMECDHLFYPSNFTTNTTNVITSLNLDKPEHFYDSKAIPSDSSNYYVSNSSIYFYNPLYKDDVKTEIMKINYTKGKLEMQNSVTVSGYLYDSFALNESKGYLRILATIPEKIPNSFPQKSEHIEAKESINILYIFDSNMKLSSKINGIAPGETIYSARYLGDYAYFVTYKNIDPLFSVDLSDPTNPKIIGSLKISGLSNYLHFYNSNLLLGIGQEIDPSTQEYIGIKLSMFDITDPTQVTEKNKFILENATYVENLHNYKTFLIDPSNNRFGFSYQFYDQAYGEYYYSTFTFDKEKGFLETGKYLIKEPLEFINNFARGIYIDHYFYLCTNHSIRSYKMGTEECIDEIIYKN